jgi:hypothetical protein
MSDEAITPRLAGGTIINKENFNEVARAVLSGATLTVTSGGGGGGGLTGYTRHFQHKNWLDFIDPVQAGGDNGFNERFHALESEFDLIAAAISSVDDAVTNLENAAPAIGLTLVLSLSDGAKIPVPTGFQQSETKFFAFVKAFQANTSNTTPGELLGFNVFAQDDGTVVARVWDKTGQAVMATGLAIAKKGGW